MFRVKMRHLFALILLLTMTFLTISSVSANDNRANDNGFVRWPVITLDGEDYYWAGASDGPNGEMDVPGHYWRQTGPDRWLAKHFNTGPFGAPSWWSSDAPDGALLYIAQVIIDEWTPEKAAAYAQRGFVHYHELINVDTGEEHPTKVGWFRHFARSNFTLDGGPAPEFSHEVTPGIDFEFIPNWMTPYNP